MNKEGKINIDVSQEDVQNIINCYEKDIKYIKELEDIINNINLFINQAIITGGYGWEYKNELKYLMSGGDLKIALERYKNILGGE